MQTLYKEYLRSGLNTLEMQDCIKMFSDSVFDTSHEIIREAFAMSKMTVLNEMDTKNNRSYSYLVFVEFLEFIARVADLSFVDSELEELPLEDKLEYLLTDLFPIVNM